MNLDLFDSPNPAHTSPHVDDRGGHVTVTCTRQGSAHSGERRERGMASSLAHAESDAPGWAAQCYALLCEYAASHHEFQIEQFRAWAYANGLPKPDEERAFGSVTQRAIRASVIVRTGYAPAASSNGSAKPVYARTARAA